MGWLISMFNTLNVYSDKTKGAQGTFCFAYIELFFLIIAAEQWTHATAAAKFVLHTTE